MVPEHHSSAKRNTAVVTVYKISASKVHLWPEGESTNGRHNTWISGWLGSINTNLSSITRLGCWKPCIAEGDYSVKSADTAET